MKKNYLIAGAITLMLAISAVIVWFAALNTSSFNSVTTKIYEVDAAEDIILDFKGARVSILEWGKSYVEVSYDNVFGKKVDFDITKVDNTLTLNTKLDFSNVKHMNIKVPKSMIHVIAGTVYAKSGIYKTVKADSSFLKYCTMADGFISKGDSISLREVKLDGICTIENENVEMRECDIDRLSLSPATPGVKLNANLRELRGNELLLQAGGCETLSALLRDSQLSLFQLDYQGKTGDVTVFSGKINKIENNSLIKMKFPKHFFEL